MLRLHAHHRTLPVPQWQRTLAVPSIPVALSAPLSLSYRVTASTRSEHDRTGNTTYHHSNTIYLCRKCLLHEHLYGPARCRFPSVGGYGRCPHGTRCIVYSGCWSGAVGWVTLYIVGWGCVAPLLPDVVGRGWTRYITQAPRRVTRPGLAHPARRPPPRSASRCLPPPLPR